MDPQPVPTTPLYPYPSLVSWLIYYVTATAIYDLIVVILTPTALPDVVIVITGTPHGLERLIDLPSPGDYPPDTDSPYRRW